LPARWAICALVKENEAELSQLLGQIESDLHTRRLQVPAHLLFQNLHQETQLLIDLFEIYATEGNTTNKNAADKVKATFWRVLFQSL